MISRRSLLQRSATATAFAGVTVAAVQCQPTDAPAATDPFLAFLGEWEAAERENADGGEHLSYDDATALVEALIYPYGHRCYLGDMPAATSAAGAAAAIRKVIELGFVEHPQDANLLKVAIDYLDRTAT